MPAMNLMRNSRWIPQRFVAMLACAAVLLGTLAPAISHAMMPNQVPPGMMKVCTSVGTKFIPVNFIVAKAAVTTTQGLPNIRGTKNDAKVACSYCDQHAGSYSILTETDYQFTTSNLTQHYLAGFYLPPRSYFHSSPPSSRAPPQA
jgi:hypothetical protein